MKFKQRKIIKSSSVNTHHHVSLSKLYACLNTKQKQYTHWVQRLKHESVLTNVIKIFDNIQFKCNPTNRKAIMAQYHELKKKTIKDLNNADYILSIEKIEQIIKIVNDTNVNTFLELKNIILVKIILIGDANQKQQNKIIFCKEVIPKIKSILSDLRIEENSIRVQLECILALHLLYFKGILINQKQKQCVISAINIKKHSIHGYEKNLQSLQTLIFLIVQFYKIIFLLKQNQKLQKQYYNLLLAYIELLKCTHLNFYSRLNQKYQIQNKIIPMKPLLLGLEIYHDSKKYQEIVKFNNQREIIDPRRNICSLELPKSKSINIKRSKEKQKKLKEGNISKLTIFEQEKNKKKDIQKPKLLLKCNKFTSKYLQQSESQTIGQNNEQSLKNIDKQQFKLSFVFLKNHQLYIANVNIKIRNAGTLYDWNLTIFGHNTCLLVYRKKGIINYSQFRKTLDICKQIWKFFKNCFKENCKLLQEIIKLQALKSSIPSNIDQQSELLLLIKLHYNLLLYFRINSIQMTVFGSTIKIPNKNIQIINKQLENQHNSNFQQIYPKRIGIIQNYMKYETKSQKMGINLVIKLMISIKNQFKIIQFVYENNSLKDVSIIEITSPKPKNNNKKQMMNNLRVIGSKLQTIQKYKFRHFILKKLIQQVKKDKYICFYQNLAEQKTNKLHSIKLEEQYDLINHQQDYKFIDKIQKKSSYNNNLLKINNYITLKFNGQFCVLRCVQMGNYNLYYNQKRKFYLMRTMFMKNQVHLVQKKVRMYSIVLYIKNQSNIYGKFIKVSSQSKDKFVKIEQKIWCNFIKNYIVKNKKHYFIIREWISIKNKQYIWQVIITTQFSKYMAISAIKLPQNIKIIYNKQQSLYLNEIRMQKWTHQSHLSDCSAFYSNYYHLQQQNNRIDGDDT